MKKGVLKSVFAALAAFVVLPGAAFAQDEDRDESFTGKSLPALGEIKEPQTMAEMIAEFRARPYEPEAYRAAEWLGMEPVLVHEIRKGLELLYLRDYKGARKFFEDIETNNPQWGKGLGAVANTLAWQAMMLENFDFRYEKQWEVSSKQARSDLTVALSTPGNEGWENFLMAGVVGIEAIHTVRRERYLPALQLAFEAMDHIERSRAAAPDFVDLKLADGMYNYWRSVLTMTSAVLPDFGDKRLEGIQQVMDVENGGSFLGPPATLAMVFTWHEERDMRRALASCLRNAAKYPDNVINNLLLGQTYANLRQFDKALAAYDRVIATSPNNTRVHYWKGVALLRSGRNQEAEQSFLAYLNSEHLESWQIGAAHFRLGQVYNRRQDLVRAEEHWKKASKLNHPGADEALARLRERQKNAGR